MNVAGRTQHRRKCERHDKRESEREPDETGPRHDPCAGTKNDADNSEQRSRSEYEVRPRAALEAFRRNQQQQRCDELTPFMNPSAAPVRSAWPVLAR